MREWTYPTHRSAIDRGVPVAVAAGGLALGVVLAVALAGGSSKPRIGVSAAGAAKPHRPATAAALQASGTAHMDAAAQTVAAAPAPVAAPKRAPTLLSTLATLTPILATHQSHLRHYNGGSYSLAYPASWAVARSNRPVANYAETQIQTTDAAAKVTIDHNPGELTDPAFKAAQVEAATSRTAGYHRIVFHPVTIGGRSAFEWVFTLSGARDPQRADIFVNTGHDGFAFLAHGNDFSRAQRAARAIAASVAVKR